MKPETVQHTPGPWTLNGGNGEAYRIDSLGQELTGLEFLNGWIAQVQKEADARLIASAPELLSCLKDALDLFPHFPENGICWKKIQKIKYIVAKAEEK